MTQTINHVEAEQYAHMHEHDSNLARCYIELKRQLAEAQRDARDWRQHREIMQMSGIEGVIFARLTIRKNGVVYSNEKAINADQAEIIGYVASRMLLELNAAIQEQKI